MYNLEICSIVKFCFTSMIEFRLPRIVNQPHYDERALFDWVISYGKVTPLTLFFHAPNDASWIFGKPVLSILCN